MRALLIVFLVFWSFASGFSQGYYIKDYSVDIEIDINGMLSVTERIRANFTEQKRGIIRVIPSLYYLPDENLDRKQYRIAFDSIQVESYNYSVSTLNNKLEIKIGNADVFLTGEHLYTIKYNVWGVAQDFENYEEVSWNVIGTQWDTYIENASFTVKLPQNVELKYSDIKSFTGALGSKESNLEIVKKASSISGGVTSKLYAREGITLSIKFPQSTFSFKEIPIHLLASSYYIENAKASFKILNNGSIDISQNYDVVFKEDYHGGFNAYIKCKYDYDDYFYHDYDSLLSFPRYGFLANTYYPIISNIKISDSSELHRSDSEFITNHTVSTRGSGKVNTYFSYNVFDLFEKVNSDYVYRALAFVDFNEYSKNHQFSVEMPLNSNQGDWSISTYIAEIYYDVDYRYKIRKTKLKPDSISNSKVWFSNSKVLSEYQWIYFELRFPQSYINNISQYDKALLIFKNNSIYSLPILLLIFLFVIWLLVGKDEKFTVVTQFYPPKGMTPAEAGVLWDYKLDKRDMISLIYHWAGEGYIRVKTHRNNDVELIKVGDLPKTANKYEHTLYKAIFGKGDEKKVSELNTNTFAKAWAKAFKQLNSKVAKDGLFNKKSVKLGRFLVRAGVVLLFSAIAYAIYQYNNYGDFQSSLSAAICGFAGIGFGLIMPKRAKNGTDQYAKLFGFIEFIKTAEIDRVRKLYSDDTSYFDRTISYAIVTGMGDIWAKKFADIIQTAPGWSENAGEPIDSLSLYEDVRRNMRYFDTFAKTSITTSGSGTGSSYSYSSSFGSSYSGSSFSSGSSGYSGGGFGGGGGSSW
jgi:uncharacterized membrane protein YgcG